MHLLKKTLYITFLFLSSFLLKTTNAQTYYSTAVINNCELFEIESDIFIDSSNYLNIYMGKELFIRGYVSYNNNRKDSLGVYAITQDGTQILAVKKGNRMMVEAGGMVILYILDEKNTE